MRRARETGAPPAPRPRLGAGTRGYKQRAERHARMRSESVYTLIDELHRWRLTAREVERDYFRFAQEFNSFLRFVRPLFVTLVMLVVSACAPEPGYDEQGLPFPRLVYVPEDAAPAELELLADQLDVWNAYVGRPVFELRVAANLADTGCALRVEIRDDLGSVGEAVRAGRYVTHPGHCWGRLLLRRDRLATIAPAHELGHSLGLHHTTDPNDLMCSHRQEGVQTPQPYVLPYLSALPHPP